MVFPLSVITRIPKESSVTQAAAAFEICFIFQKTTLGSKLPKESGEPVFRQNPLFS